MTTNLCPHCAEQMTGLRCIGCLWAGQRYCFNAKQRHARKHRAERRARARLREQLANEQQREAA